MIRVVHRIFTPVLAALIALTAAAVASLWDRAPRDPDAAAATRLPAHPRFTDAYMRTFCRLPTDAETIDWVLVHPDDEQPANALERSEEGQRVAAVRRLYHDVFGDNRPDAGCADVRRWVDAPLDLAGIGRAIAALPEARRIAQVRAAFLDAFGRDPRGWDEASLRRWVDAQMTPGEIRRRLATQRPLVGVHYFMWYGQGPRGWGNDATVVDADSPPPLLGRYASAEPRVIATHIRQMIAAGFDFVIIHINAESPGAWARARAFFDEVRGRRLRAALLLDGLYRRSPDAKAMWVDKVKTEFGGHPNYFLYHGEPLVMLFSAPIDFQAPGVTLRNVYWTDRYGPGDNTFNALRRLSPDDWPFWSPSPQPLVNGVVPVVPGYTDTHLGRTRSMEFPRNNGELYHDQWRRALALSPELIMVYSWNEYFEQTAIEPTREWGDTYLRWTACYIAHAHRGTGGTC